MPGTHSDPFNDDATVGRFKTVRLSSLADDAFLDDEML